MGPRLGGNFLQLSAREREEAQASSDFRPGRSRDHQSQDLELDKLCCGSSLRAGVSSVVGTVAPTLRDVVRIGITGLCMPLEGSVCVSGGVTEHWEP